MNWMKDSSGVSSRRIAGTNRYSTLNQTLENVYDVDTGETWGQRMKRAYKRKDCTKLNSIIDAFETKFPGPWSETESGDRVYIVPLPSESSRKRQRVETTTSDRPSEPTDLETTDDDLERPTIPYGTDLSEITVLGPGDVPDVVETDINNFFDDYDDEYFHLDTIDFVKDNIKKGKYLKICRRMNTDKTDCDHGPGMSWLSFSKEDVARLIDAVERWYEESSD